MYIINLEELETHRGDNRKYLEELLLKVSRDHMEPTGKNKIYFDTLLSYNILIKSPQYKINSNTTFSQPDTSAPKNNNNNGENR